LKQEKKKRTEKKDQTKQLISKQKQYDDEIRRLHKQTIKKKENKENLNLQKPKKKYMKQISNKSIIN